MAITAGARNGVAVSGPLAIARNDLAIIAAEPAVYSVLVVMPVIVILFLAPVLGPALQQQGYAGLPPVEVASPGLAVMFDFFVVTLVGYSILDERRWNTWPRLRISSLSPLTILLAKGVVPLGTSLWQQITLFTVGVLWFHLSLGAAAASLVTISLPLAACVVSLGMAIASFARTARQVSVFGNVSTLLLGGLGGALTPVALLPVWVRSVAPATPGFWAIRGLHALLLDRRAVTSGLLSSVVLFGFAAVFLSIAAFRTARSEGRE
jgi:ABC-2 type transport system permease protein